MNEAERVLLQGQKEKAAFLASLHQNPEESCGWASSSYLSDDLVGQAASSAPGDIACQKKVSSSSSQMGTKERVQDKVDNLDQFYETEFGKRVKDSTVKLKGAGKHGKAILKVVKKVPESELKKGDQLYLDGLHKDHFEVFDKKGRFEKVLNLDGSINRDKTIKALKQRRYL